MDDIQAKRCMALWANVLLQALQDCRSKQIEIRDDAIRWVFDDSHAIGSFNWIADLLGVDSAWMRKKVGHALLARLSSPLWSDVPFAEEKATSRKHEASEEDASAKSAGLAGQQKK